MHGYFWYLNSASAVPHCGERERGGDTERVTDKRLGERETHRENMTI